MRLSLSPSTDSTAVMTGSSPLTAGANTMLPMAPNREIRWGWMELTDIGLLRILSRESSDTKKKRGNTFEEINVHQDNDCVPIGQYPLFQNPFYQHFKLLPSLRTSSPITAERITVVQPPEFGHPCVLFRDCGVPHFLAILNYEDDITGYRHNLSTCLLNDLKKSPYT